jgi:Na+-transporting methylmalonyl-CoA/oxaloacetate decarboxylase gamma subunit
MTLELGFLMLLYGMGCIFIAAIIIWYVINKFVVKKDDDNEME